MKILFIPTLCLTVMCSANKQVIEKQGDNISEKVVEQPVQQNFFYSYWTGGEKNKGFQVVEDASVVYEKYTGYRFGKELLTAEDAVSNTDFKLPKNHKAVFYFFGTINSGSYTPLGIEKIDLKGEVLQVYLKKNQEKFDPLQPQIMVLSQPWMLFSVPKKYHFTKVEIM